MVLDRPSGKVVASSAGAASTLGGVANDDETRIAEIRAWFDERGFDLYVHEIASHGWRAPYMPKGTRIGNADYGVGHTPRQAAEDAMAAFQGGRAIFAEDTFTATEAASVVISPETIVHEREIFDPTVLSDAIETLTAYGWYVACEDEPDGKVTCAAYDQDSREFLRSAVGDDFHDAVLNLIADLTPPSIEVRREGQERRSDNA